jgi:predicted XRE-type DNA-binding protein
MGCWCASEGGSVLTSSNVFADLGLPNAEQELLKAQLTLQIYRIIKQRGITQTQAAKVLGISHPFNLTTPSQCVIIHLGE